MSFPLNPRRLQSILAAALRVEQRAIRRQVANELATAGTTLAGIYLASEDADAIGHAIANATPFKPPPPPRTTAAVVSRGLRMAVNLNDPEMRAVLAAGGTRLIQLPLADAQRVVATIERLRGEGAGVPQITKYLKEQVPAGRFGTPARRARTIARTESKYAQNHGTIAAYEASGVVGRVQAVDCQIAGEACDPECEERNGKVFPIEEAKLIDDHPNGTLSWSPVIDRRPTPPNKTQERETLRDLEALPKKERRQLERISTQMERAYDA